VRRPSGPLCAAVAAAIYLAIALFLLRTVLPAPAERLPYPVVLHESEQNLVELDHADQSMVVATIAGNARRLLDSPTNALGSGQCYPMPDSYTLGEHMLTMGLLAAPTYALSHDPILSYNVAYLLTLWIPGLTMYALALFLTRSQAAAFVAGLAFALLPGRIIDPAHPYVHGDRWTPLAILFLHRLTRGGGLRDAFGLAVTMALAVGESLYPLVAMGLYLAVYGLFLLARDARGVLRAIPYLVVVASFVALSTWVVLGPYLQARAVWGILSGRFSYPMDAGEFAPGREHFPGYAVAALALFALVDRVSGRRHEAWEGRDMRLALLVGGILVAWCGLERVPLPFTTVIVPSPLLLAKSFVPGLDAVRGLQAIALGLGVATTALAAYGVVAVAERVGRRRIVLVAVCAALAIVGTRVYGPLARASFGRTLRLAAWEGRPAPVDIALIREAPSGALLHVPVPFVEGDVSFKAATMLLLASYGPRDSAACYNSFGSLVQKQVWLLGTALPRTSSAEALATLGFGTVLLHEDGSNASKRFRARLEPDSSVLGPERRSEGLASRTLVASGSASTDWTALESAPADPVRVIGPATRLFFPIRNRGAETFRHPSPLAPSDLLLRWEALEPPPDGPGKWTTPLRALLPIAIGAGATLPIEAAVELPAHAGRYRLTLERAGAPERALATRDIAVQETLDTPSLRSTADLKTLGPEPSAAARLAVDETILSFAVRNEGTEAYRDPSPRALKRLRVEWVDEGGEIVDAERLVAYVPPFLPPGASVSIEVPVFPPPPGRYVARLVPALADRTHVIGSREVDVVARPAT
jgi:hypothetical protein